MSTTVNTSPSIITNISSQITTDPYIKNNNILKNLMKNYDDKAVEFMKITLEELTTIKIMINLKNKMGKSDKIDNLNECSMIH